jgi:hypothetical protein
VEPTLDRDENEFGSGPDDWGLALDEVALVQVSGGAVSITVHAGYYGDSVIPKVTFSADLLLYRPTLDGVKGNLRWQRLVKETRYRLRSEYLVHKPLSAKRSSRPLRAMVKWPEFI